jgi:hypothetical protein
MTVKDLIHTILKQLQDGSVRLDSLVAVSGVNAESPDIPVVAVNGDEDTGVLTVFYATPEEVEAMLDEDGDGPDEDGGFDPESN